MKRFPENSDSSTIRPGRGFPESVAVLRALQLGDLLCAVPCFRAMKQAWPEATVTLVGLPWAKGFVARFSNYLDGFQEFPGFDGIPERAYERARMLSFMADGKSFDIAIQLHGDGSVTNQFLLRLRSRMRAGFFPAGEKSPDPARFIPYPEGEHEIRRLLKLMHHLGIPTAGEHLEFPLTHADYHEAHEIAANSRLLPGQFVCLHPGARDPKRRWPLGNFLEVAKALEAKGLRIVLTGTSEEADQAETLRGQLGASCLDLTGKTSLGALGALFKKARIVISNDTGISHLAAALAVPSVVIFSGSDRRRWAPLDTTRHRALGDPFASPVVSPTPADVIREASSLIGGGPLRLQARGGGFPVLPAVNWVKIKRVLLVQEGSEADLVMLAPCISALQPQWSRLALLTSAEAGELVPLFPGIDRLLIAAEGSLSEPVSEGAVRKLVDRLRECAFDAAIVFTRLDQSPYTAAYICYLAGIPVRVGASQEFGGALLTHWVRKLDRSLGPEERGLALLRSVGLPSDPKDSGLLVPAEIEAQTKVELAEAGVSSGHGFVLLDDVGCSRTGEDALAESLRNMTGMKVLQCRSFRSRSVVEWAAFVRSSDLVIALNPLISRLADAFGRPLVAAGAAARPSDGWRPRRSLAKLLDDPATSQDDLLQAVRTLLWLATDRRQASTVRIEKRVGQSLGFSPGS